MCVISFFAQDPVVAMQDICPAVVIVTSAFAPIFIGAGLAPVFLPGAFSKSVDLDAMTQDELQLPGDFAPAVNLA